MLPDVSQNETPMRILTMELIQANDVSFQFGSKN